MKTIDIIVPIYKGNNYIKKLIKMFEQNAAQIDGEVTVLLLNDYPEEPIDIDPSCSDIVNIKVLENEANYGIHKTRIIGLENSNSDYVWFFDQDDEVSTIFLKSQLECIGDNDAVICNGKNRGRKIYSDYINDKIRYILDNLISGANKIVSPGHVLIKRNAIPNEWSSKIMTSNCADDYYLWLLMYFNSKSFVYNDKVLFLHTYSGENTSNDEIQMKKSEIEMIDYLILDGYVKSGSKLFDFKEALQKNIDTTTDSVGRRFLRDEKKIDLLSTWIINLTQNRGMNQLLKDEEIKSVIIYGMDVLGFRLLDELIRCNTTVIGYMDRNSNIECELIPRIELGDSIAADATIIVTSATQFNLIKNNLRTHYDNKILSLEYLIFNMDNSLDS